jgi:hypothetical protein
MGCRRFGIRSRFGHHGRIDVIDPLTIRFPSGPFLTFMFAAPGTRERPKTSAP